MTEITAEPGERMLYPLHRFEALSELTRADITDLQRLGAPPVKRRRGEVIWHEGQPTEGFHLLLEGWVSSSVLLRNGRRLLQKLHLPGDILGTPSLALPGAADTLTALTDLKTSFVSERSFREVLSSNRRLSALFFMAAQMERIALMDALASAGHSSAIENMAHLLLDLHRRLSGLGAVVDDSLFLPISQERIGDILGITSVHVNRVLREMVHRGLIEVEGQRIGLLDLQSLRELSPLPPRYPRIQPAWLPSAEAAH